MLVIIRWAWQNHLNNTGDISDYLNSFKTPGFFLKDIAMYRGIWHDKED